MNERKKRGEKATAMASFRDDLFSELDKFRGKLLDSPEVNAERPFSEVAVSQ